MSNWYWKRVPAPTLTLAVGEYFTVYVLEPFLYVMEPPGYVIPSTVIGPCTFAGMKGPDLY